MAQINLLPTDLAPRPTVIRTSGVVKQILIVGLVVFIVAAVVLAGLYLFYSRDLKASQAKVAEFKASIKALEATEQRVLLVKDRLEKVKLVLGMDSSMDELEAASSFLSTLPEGSSLASAEFRSNETRLSIASPNTSVTAGVIASVTSGAIYKTVDMTSFTYTPETGFNIKFTLIK